MIFIALADVPYLPYNQDTTVGIRWMCVVVIKANRWLCLSIAQGQDKGMAKPHYPNMVVVSVGVISEARYLPKYLPYLHVHGGS
jgi:hypothetical protein